MRKKGKTSKSNFILDNYKKSFNYIKNSKNYIYSIVLIFFIFGLIGFFIPPPTEVLNIILEFIQELLEKTQGMGALELIGFIFLNNLQVSLLAILAGLFFGVVPIVLSISNGYLIGFVASVVVNSEGLLSLWRIFPHGVFELPALFISLGLGLRLGAVFIKYYSKKYIKSYPKLHIFIFFAFLFLFVIFLQVINNLNILGFIFLFIFFIVFFTMVLLCFLNSEFRKEFFPILENSAKTFLFVVIPLLIIAAVIEGTFIFLF